MWLSEKMESLHVTMDVDTNMNATFLIANMYLPQEQGLIVIVSRTVVYGIQRWKAECKKYYINQNYSLGTETIEIMNLNLYRIRVWYECCSK